jgi:hypothetical protein
MHKPVGPLISVIFVQAAPSLTGFSSDFDTNSPLYPVPTGKAAIRRTIAPNSRCVRCLSASSSQ